MGKKMENDMETGIIMVYLKGFRVKGLRVKGFRV